MNTEKPRLPEAKQGIIAALQNQGQAWAGLKSASFDPDALWERVDRDVELLRELIAVFEAEFPGMLAKVEAAIGNGDPAELERAAHKVKGSVLQFSAHSAAAAALELEQMGRSGRTADAQPVFEKLKQQTAAMLKSLKVMMERLSQ
jgi:HPt (histidine-containing phosphotransfer) domain-containing protein